MNDHTLETEVFPALAECLRQKGEVFVPFAYSSQFSHFLKRSDYDLWLATEQEAIITDDDETRFYLRRSP